MADPKNSVDGVPRDPRLDFLKRRAPESPAQRRDALGREEEVFALGDGLSSDSEEQKDLALEPLVVIDWENPDEFNEIYIDEDLIEEASEDGLEEGDPDLEGTPLSAPAFPPDQAERIRERAWAEYASCLASTGTSARSRKAPRRRPGSGLRASVEILASLGVLTLLNVWAFPDDLGFRRLEFNPYLIPVILLGVRYGTSAGLAAGLLSALWVAQASGRVGLEDGSLVLPGLLVVIGTLTGALSRSQGRRLDYFRNLVHRLRANQARAHRTLSAMSAVVRELEGRIEAETVSAPALYQLSRGMGSELPEKVYESMLGVLSGDLGVLRAGVYERRGETFALVASIDRRPIPRPFAPRIEVTRGLAELALRKNGVVSMFDPEAASIDRSPLDAGILAGPFRQGQALVVVFDMELLNFSPATPSRLSSILDWAQESLARSRRRGRPRSAPVATASNFDPLTGAWRSPHFMDFVRREENRARRSGQKYRVLEVRIGSTGPLPDSRRSFLRGIVSRALFAYTRDFDTIAMMEGDVFIVLLPMHEGDSPQAIGDRIQNAVDRTWSGPRVPLEFRFIDPYDVSSPSGQTSPWMRAEAA